MVVPHALTRVDRSAYMCEHLFAWASFQPRPHPSTVGEGTRARHGGPDAFARYEAEATAGDAAPGGAHLYLWYVTPNVVVGSLDARFERTMLHVARAVSHAHAGSYYDAARAFRRAETSSRGWKTALKRNVVCLDAERNAKAAHLCVAAVHAGVIRRVVIARTRVGLLRALHAHLCTLHVHDDAGGLDEPAGGGTDGGRGSGSHEGVRAHAPDPLDQSLVEFQNEVAAELLTLAAQMFMDEDKDVARACACLERATKLGRNEEAAVAYEEHKRVLRAVFATDVHPAFFNGMLPPLVALPPLPLD